MGIVIEEPGLLTTVQDLGRTGYQAFGVSPAGVMDRDSAIRANLLLGNPRDAAVLEMTLCGASLRFDAGNVIAVCGAEMQPTLDGEAMPMNQAVSVKAGAILRFTYAQEGLRTYVAFFGGLDLPVVMGSRATHLGSKTGGFHGRKLQTGDKIGFLSPAAALPRQGLRCFPPERRGSAAFLRVVAGPQAFSAESLQTLLHSPYRLSAESDRMGCRLQGEAVASPAGGSMITDGIVFGSVQIPPSGQPIIMMADRQTTGGYPKIATVISADLPKLAQCRPGAVVRFRLVTVEEAQAAYADWEASLQRLNRQCNEPGGGSLYEISMGGRKLTASVEKVEDCAR